MPKIIDNVRNEILRVATDMFYNSELNDISIRKIAIKSKVGLGTVYNYFSSKEALLAEVVDFKAREQLELLKNTVSKKKDIREKAYEMFRLIKEDISNIDNIRFKNMVTMLNEYPIKKKEIFEKKCIDFHSSIIEYMKDDFGLRNDVVARIFFTTLLWAVASGKAGFEDVWSELERLI